jgi:D-ribose pyranose/furanose isomerase RbsD
MSPKTLKRDEEILDRKIARYLADLDRADEEENDETYLPIDPQKVKDALALLNSKGYKIPKPE